MHVRRATHDDLPRLVEIHTSAFPDPRGHDARVTNFEANALGELGDLLVAEDARGVIAHAFLFPLEAWFGGARVRAGGIASVGVAPEARGGGVGGAILDALHRAAEERGDAITILFAFRQGFYARHGYAPTSTTKRLVINPHAIPGEWRAAGMHARAMGADDRAAVESIYETEATKATGWIVRSARLWERRIADERRRWIVVHRDGDVRGYVAWTVWQDQSHAKTTMHVHELVARDDDARRALFGVVGAQRDQVHEVHFEIAAGDPIERALFDADRDRHGDEDVEHSLGDVVAGPMVRLVDATRALTARGYASDGAIDLAIDGGRVAAACGATHALDVAAGRARVVDPHGAPTLALDAKTLAAIAYGALSASDAARLGWLRGASKEALARADSLFALPPYFALDPF